MKEKVENKWECNIIKFIKFFNLNRCNLLYVNYTSIKLLSIFTVSCREKERIKEMTLLQLKSERENSPESRNS